MHAELAGNALNPGASRAPGAHFIPPRGWDTAHVVVEGSVPDMMLSASERLWLSARWRACRGG